MEILEVKSKIDENKLKQIAYGMKEGKLCLFPTETVYGVGTNGLDETAVQKIYEVKKRSLKNPINLLVSDMAMIETITQDISPLEYKLMEAFFPGPFTIILKKKSIVPNIVTANSDFVGIRMPDHPIARKLPELAKCPIAAPSANISGKLSITNLKDMFSDFSDGIDFIVDSGESQIGLESTIVKVIDGVPHILRPGSITPKQIEEIARNVVLEENTNSSLPSSDRKHYQLEVPSCLVYSEDSKKMIAKILELSNLYTNPVILCCLENTSFYAPYPTIPIASRDDLESFSRNLFSCLHKASLLSPNMLLMEGVKKEGLGIAIMNRLENVCEVKYV